MKFPARYTFNLLRDIETGEQRVTACESTNQKVKTENMKYRNLKHMSFDHNKRVALLGFEYVISEEDLKNFFAKYEKWNVLPTGHRDDRTTQ